MWILTMRSPVGEPQEVVLKPGKNSIGRHPDNDLVVTDQSASRTHAEIAFDPKANVAIIQDLGSTNGTFVNRERLAQPHRLAPGDAIRIGEHLINVDFRAKQTAGQPQGILPGTQLLTRELLLESLDRHAVLLYKVSSRLNTILDIDTALQEVASMMKVSMGADKCEVILSEELDKLPEMGFPTSIAQQAIDQRSAIIVQDAASQPDLGQSASLLRIRTAMCVPVISEGEILALIYVYKTRPLARPFDQRDLQLAVAISHQAALTIQRMHLLRMVRREQLVSKLLQRFISPQEADYFLHEYLETGKLPQLAERTLTILVADIQDSTGMAERLGPRRFGELLNRYFEELTEIVFDYGGMLNKYMGDGLMAVFGMTRQRPNPEERAVQTALNILNQLEVLNQDIPEKIQIGIGVNTGPAVAGYQGTEEHVEFTVLGDSVNVAWGLERLARPNRVLIGQTTFEALGNGFTISQLGPVELKKRTHPIGVYEVLPA